MKIKHQLILTHGLLILLSLVIVFVNIVEYKHIEEDSALVNRSGEMRAMNYRLAQLANNIINDELERSSLKTELVQAMDDYEERLYAVIADDNRLQKSFFGSVRKNAGNIIWQKTEKIGQSVIPLLAEAEDKWEHKYKQLYTEIILNDSQASLETINTEIASYVQLMNNIVTTYARWSWSKIQAAIVINLLLVMMLIITALISFNIAKSKIEEPIGNLIEDMKQISLFEKENKGRRASDGQQKNEIKEMESYFDALNYDYLTDALNRRAGLLRLDKLMAKCHEKEPLSLCFLDVNGLKDVNDNLGHEVGDELIITVADMVREEIRAEDFFIRMGGDEFLIVFASTPLETAESIWQRIEKKFEQINIGERRPYLISISYGIVEYRGEEGIDTNTLITKADRLMYENKKEIKTESHYHVLRDDEVLSGEVQGDEI